MLEGLVEFSIIRLSEIDKIKKRIDAEYYQRKFLKLEEKINKIGKSNLKSVKAKLDCSAFYPSITEYYNFNSNGVPFLRVNEIQDGLVNINENTAFLPESILLSNGNTIAIAYPEDIIIAKGGNTLAKVGLITNEYPYYALSRDLILIRTNAISNCNKYFLWVFLHSQMGQDLLWRTASQTGQPHLTLPSIEKIGFPRYSLLFENLFEDLYKQSASLKQKSKNSYSEAEALLLQEIGMQDFQPSIEPINIKNFKDSFLQTGRLDAEHYQKKYEEVETIIKSGDYYSITSIFDLLNNPSPSKYTSAGTKVIKTKNVRIPAVEINDINDHTNEDCLQVKKNDLIFASMGVGSLGRVSYVDFDISDCTIDGTLRVFRTKEEYLNKNYEIPTLLFLTSKYGQELIYKYVIGSTGIISISKENIENLIIPRVSQDVAAFLTKLILESQKLKTESEQLLKVAKQAVEIAIEVDEETAINFINTFNLLKTPEGIN